MELPQVYQAAPSTVFPITKGDVFEPVNPHQMDIVAKVSNPNADHPLVLRIGDGDGASDVTIGPRKVGVLNFRKFTVVSDAVRFMTVELMSALPARQ